jgi:hypothetical protein
MRKAGPELVSKIITRHAAMKYWETIADSLSKTGWSWGCVSALDSKGRTIWIADAHPSGRRIVCHRRSFLFKSFVEHFYQFLKCDKSLSAMERPHQILRIQ